MGTVCRHWILQNAAHSFNGCEAILQALGEQLAALPPRKHSLPKAVCSLLRSVFCVEGILTQSGYSAGRSGMHLTYGGTWFSCLCKHLLVGITEISFVPLSGALWPACSMNCLAKPGIRPRKAVLVPLLLSAILSNHGVSSFLHPFLLCIFPYFSPLSSFLSFPFPGLCSHLPVMTQC